MTIGGEAAQSADFLDAVYGNFPLVIALISLLTFLLLARAFRSLVLPLKAVLLNLLSVAAAWGLMVLVWQHGFGSEAIWGIEATQAINVEMPIVVFAFLFGISMDYQVFIISRMREAYDRTGSTETAVVEGIGRTGRLVTSAALILVLAFVALQRQPGHRGEDVRHRARRRHPDRRHDHPRRPRARRRRPPRPLELVAPARPRASSGWSRRWSGPIPSPSPLPSRRSRTGRRIAGFRARVKGSLNAPFYGRVHGHPIRSGRPLDPVVAFAGRIPADPARAALPDAPRSAAPGKSFAVPTVSRGRPIHYYLSRDSKRSLEDVRLIGPTPSGVPAAKTARVSVPPVAAGAYRLLSCSGSHCAASRNVVTVADTPKTQMQAFSDTHDTGDPYLASNQQSTPASVRSRRHRGGCRRRRAR